MILKFNTIARKLEKAKNFAEKHCIPSFGSYEDMARADNVDIVYVSVITALHKDAVVIYTELC